MKWGGYNDAAATRFSGLVKKLFSARALTALLTLGTLAVLLGNAKWSP
jgi:hypothetical protein